MKRFVTALVLSLSPLSLSLVACSDDEPAQTSSSSSSSSSTSAGGEVGPKTTVSSCDLIADVGYCLDFAIGAPDDEARNNCLGANTTGGYNGKTNETASCPTASRVGTCLYTTVNSIKTTYRYYGPKFTAATAEENCQTLGGPVTFKPE